MDQCVTKDGNPDSEDYKVSYMFKHHEASNNQIKSELISPTKSIYFQVNRR